jgi:hypothetical protein
MTALTKFFAERVFGPDRAAMLAAHLPASAADHAQRNAAKVARLQKKLAKIDVSERAVITELETPIAPGDPPPGPCATASAPASPSYTPSDPATKPS